VEKEKQAIAAKVMPAPKVSRRNSKVTLTDNALV
jgi:hypothetical protein